MHWYQAVMQTSYLYYKTTRATPSSCSLKPAGGRRAAAAACGLRCRWPLAAPDIPASKPYCNFTFAGQEAKSNPACAWEVPACAGSSKRSPRAPSPSFYTRLEQPPSSGNGWPAAEAAGERRRASPACRGTCAGRGLAARPVVDPGCAGIALLPGLPLGARAFVSHARGDQTRALSGSHRCTAIWSSMWVRQTAGQPPWAPALQQTHLQPLDWE